MNTTQAQQADLKLHLHRRAFHRNRIKPGTAVVCNRGLVWATKSNDLKDYILQPGARMIVSQRADLLVEALSDADVTILSPN